MDKIVNAYTEATNKNFHLLRTSIFSFIKNNPWFTGTINLLDHPMDQLSTRNYDILLKIYPKLAIKLQTSHPIFSVIDKYKGRVQYFELVNSALKWTVFNESTENESLLYFSNYSIFQKSCNFISENKLGKALNSVLFFHLSEKISLSEEVDHELSNRMLTSNSLDLQLNNHLNSCLNPSFYSEANISFSNEYLDSKFITMRASLASKDVILFTTLNNSAQYSKINQVWLFKNKESSQFLVQPSSFNSDRQTINAEEQPRPIPHVKQQNSSIPITLNRSSQNRFLLKSKLTSLSSFKEYLTGKKIAIIANSSELLEHQHGELIDSHDVVIRFNGYPIEPTHTGTKTSVHCIFRQARFNLDQPSDYLIVFSKPIDLWHKAVSDICASYPSKKILNYNYPALISISAALKKSYLLPTSGLSMILLLEELKIPHYSLSLFGFNGYTNGLNSIFRSNSDKNISSVHNYLLELKYLTCKFEKGEPGILKKK